MMRYDTYKPSGIDWSLDIPTHWDVRRMKDVVSIISKGTTPSTEGETYTDFGVRYIKAENINDNGSVSESPAFFISESTNKLLSRSILKANDLLLVIAGATTGKIAILKPEQLPANTNQAVCFLRLRNREKETLRYKYYFLNSSYVQSLVWLYAVTSAQPNLPMAVLSRFSLYYPSTEEQTAIAQYLDAKTQAIDNKINLLTQKADTYKELRKSIIHSIVSGKWLIVNGKAVPCEQVSIIDGKLTIDNSQLIIKKESGIDWIGQIPEHWEVKRFKDVVAKYTTGGTPSTANVEYFTGDNTWICISDISDDKYISSSKMFLSNEAIKEANIIKTPKGSLLYSFKLSIGKMAFVTKDVYTNEAILSIFPSKNIDLEYYYFMLPMFLFLAATENIYGAKMLNQKLIANAFVLHPPKEEQTAIANYLDEKTQKIDAIVSNIGKQIETLKELRKTLINDVVTGKIMVNGKL